MRTTRRPALAAIIAGCALVLIGGLVFAVLGGGSNAGAALSLGVALPLVIAGIALSLRAFLRSKRAEDNARAVDAQRPSDLVLPLLATGATEAINAIIARELGVSSPAFAWATPRAISVNHREVVLWHGIGEIRPALGVDAAGVSRIRVFRLLDGVVWRPAVGLRIAPERELLLVPDLSSPRLRGKDMERIVEDLSAALGSPRRERLIEPH